MNQPDLFAGLHIQSGSSIVARGANGDAIARRRPVFTPPTARKTDPETSHEAAHTVFASPGRVVAMKLLRLAPATDFELAEASGMQQTSIGKRRHECMSAGLVRPLLCKDGQKMTRPTPSGASAIVWEITDAGVAWLHEGAKA